MVGFVGGGFAVGSVQFACVALLWPLDRDVLVGSSSKQFAVV